MQNPFKDGEGKQSIVRRLPGVPDATVDDYIADAWAKATSVAPCIAADTFPTGNTDEDKAAKEAELVAILRGIILRWNEGKSGAATAKMAGPYQLQMDTRPSRGFILLPQEIVDLQKLCRKPSSPFTFDTIPEDFQPDIPLYGAVINSYATGPAGEWSPDRVIPDV